MITQTANRHILKKIILLYAVFLQQCKLEKRKSYPERKIFIEKKMTHAFQTCVVQGSPELLNGCRNRTGFPMRSRNEGSLIQCVGTTEKTFSLFHKE